MQEEILWKQKTKNETKNEKLWKNRWRQKTKFSCYYFGLGPGNKGIEGNRTYIFFFWFTFLTEGKKNYQIRKRTNKYTTLYTCLCMITFVGYPIGRAHFVDPFSNAFLYFVPPVLENLSKVSSALLKTSKAWGEWEKSLPRRRLHRGGGITLRNIASKVHAGQKHKRISFIYPVVSKLTPKIRIKTHSDELEIVKYTLHHKMTTDISSVHLWKIVF